MAVGSVGSSAMAYIQQNNQANARGTELDLARMQKQHEALKAVVSESFAIKAEQNQTMNKIKESALNTAQARIDTWA
ncbi:hypothetical protein [Propionivibrio soli]|jgi:hypothetical protein|uniref:hypothetical protein n=1 Tax=Propionivibrio soli TaxID=2976531 RepID=UPI0021E7EED2|nr:hypothetical protein [Propionivibrio soli]